MRTRALPSLLHSVLAFGALPLVAALVVAGSGALSRPSAQPARADAPAGAAARRSTGSWWRSIPPTPSATIRARRRRWPAICWRRDSRPATSRSWRPRRARATWSPACGAAARSKPLLLLAHLDVVEARREDWSVDPFTLLERDGYFYGRGTGDDKAMAAIFVANLIRYKREGFVPDRDLIVALTADEEGGAHNGVRWLLANHRPLIDAGLALNEGGGGAIKNGAYVSNNIQASEKIVQSFRLEVKNKGGHSSLPVKDNAIYHLAEGLTRLAQADFPVRLDEVNRAFFERTGAALGRAARRRHARLGRRVTRPERRGASRGGGPGLQLPHADDLRGHAARGRPRQQRAAADGHRHRQLPRAARRDAGGRAPDARRDPGQRRDHRDADRLLLPEPALAAHARGDARRRDGDAPSCGRACPSCPSWARGPPTPSTCGRPASPPMAPPGSSATSTTCASHGRDERILVRSLYEGQDYLYRLVKILSSP